jgi:hypothetical protein
LAFDTYATGEWSVAQLATALTDGGLRTRATASRSPAALTVASLHRVLTNPYYKGIVTMNGAQHAGSHEPLVPTATWDTVQRILASRRQGERSRIHTHYLKSTIRCFNCQRRLLVHNARSKSGRVYDYFVCSGRQHGTPRCAQSALRISDVERRVEDAYERIQIPTHRRKEIELHWQDRLAAEASGSEQKRSELAVQAQEIRLRQEKLLEAYYSDALPHDLFIKEQRKLADSLSRTEAEEERLSDDVAFRMKHLAESLDLLEDACDRYLAAAPADRKQLNNALLDRVLIGPNPEDICVALRPEIAKLGLRGATEEDFV